MKEDFTFLWLIQLCAGSLTPLADALSLYIRLNLSWASLSQRQYIWSTLCFSSLRKGERKICCVKTENYKTNGFASLLALACWQIQSALPLLMQIFHLLFRTGFIFLVASETLICTSWMTSVHRKKLTNAITTAALLCNAFTSLPAERCMANWLRHSKWQLICAFPEISEFEIAKMARLMASFCLCAARFVLHIIHLVDKKWELHMQLPTSSL